MYTDRKARFQWVMCQLGALGKCHSSVALKKALSTLPRTLFETYDRIIAEIHEDDRQDVLRLLQWVTFSVRGISLDEAVEVLATNPETEYGPFFDSHRRLLDPRDILTICSGLLTIGERGIEKQDDRAGNFEGKTSDQDLAHMFQTSTLKLAHFTIREYLVSENPCTGNVTTSFHHFNNRLADTTIATTCLAYLLQFDQFDCITQNTSTIFPLSTYAALHWIQHATSDAENSDTFRKLIIDLFQPRHAMYGNWLHLCKLNGWRPPWGRNGTLLYYTSLAGLERASQCLLNNGADVNSQGGCHGNPLQAASVNGHERVVRLLLKHGADTNARGGYYGYALQAASVYGRDRIVRMLLAKGADVNGWGGVYGTALQAASLGGEVEIVRLLLENGADADAQGGEYGSALQAASSQGHSVLAQLLLDSGADVNAKEGLYGSALVAASACGHDDIVHLLLERGGNVHVQGGQYANALQAASKGGHVGIVRLLLESGGNANSQNDENGGVLHMASADGHEEIVRLLLDYGANVDAAGGDSGSALQAASLQGHNGIVRLLLEYGADVNAEGGQYCSALQAASSQGHDGIVQLLLEWGADVSAEGGQYGSALQAASSQGHDGIARLLLDRVELNPIGSRGCLWCRCQDSRRNGKDHRVGDVVSRLRSFQSFLREWSFTQPRDRTSGTIGMAPIMLSSKGGYLLLVVTLMAHLGQTQELSHLGKEAQIGSMDHLTHPGGLTGDEAVQIKSLLPINSELSAFMVLSLLIPVLFRSLTLDSHWQNLLSELVGHTKKLLSHVSLEDDSVRAYPYVYNSGSASHWPRYTNRDIV